MFADSSSSATLMLVCEETPEGAQTIFALRQKLNFGTLIA
jgi:hypothetical protein